MTRHLRSIQGMCQVEVVDSDGEDTYVHEFDSLENLLQWLKEFNVSLSEVTEAFAAEAD